MTLTQAAAGSAPGKPLRLWPGVAIVIVQWLVAFGVPFAAPDAEPFSLPVGMIAVMGGALGGLAIVVWWLFFSRAPWIERVGAVVLMVAAIAAAKVAAHASIAGAGMGMLLYFASVPYLCLALVAWAVVARNLAVGPRRALLVAAIAIATVPWTLVRTSGVGGSGSEYHWRWTPTPEQLLLAQPVEEPKPLPPAAAEPAAPVAEATAVEAAEGTPAEPAAPIEAAAVPAAPAVVDLPAEWPGFRGPARDGVVRGTRIATDWSATPPVEIWRRRVGPGWSSFAVSGPLIYTQEQRGEEEIVACYRLSNGEPVWRHADAVRFWESNGGAGPRATPTIDGARLYAFGATGILNALDARTGAVAWSRDVAADTGRAIPIWGFSSSPLVVDDVVVVAAAGTLVAYDRTSGDRRWSGPSYGGSYSSPHRAVIDGVPQIVLLGGPGAISVAPADGAVLWEHEWSPGAIVQPGLIDGGDVLVNALASTGGTGLRRLEITRGANGWSIEERWTSRGLKPYYNDFVVHEGHAYGFDGSILSSIDLTDGARKWKGGRYGNGQLVLLADQDALLVLSEEGELALVKAAPDGYTELAKMTVLDAKTWNHPVVVGNVLLVRNGEEMAAYRLPAARP